jgi:prepilin-type N-terminal cleavage/methylation domain-containing protein
VSRFHREGGYTLVEMVTVMLILSVVMTGLTTLFVQGGNAEVDMNNRFRAQLNARVALDRMRRDLHCASIATASSSTSVTFTDSCATGGTVSWCIATVSGRQALLRQLGVTACSASSTRYADNILATNSGGSTPTYFAYQAQSTSTLAVLYVCIPVNVQPKRVVDTYALSDAIVLRNSTRTGSSSTVSQPACP